MAALATQPPAPLTLGAAPPAPRGVSEFVLAIGYIRVSKAREEMISPELQKDAIMQWAARTGRYIIDWVVDLDVSGRHWNRRIMGVIERIERGEAREVAVWKYSRFGRERTGCALNLGRVQRAGGELQSATEDIDAATSVGRLTRGMLMEIAAFESDRASETWAEAWAWRIENGLPSRGGPRLGYDIIGRIPNPLGGGTIRDPNLEEQYVPSESGPAPKLIPRIFEMSASGKGGFREYAKLVNNNGLLTSRGKPFSHNSVRRMMHSGFAAGYIHVHDPNCDRQHDADKRPCENRIHLPGRHDALVELDLWESWRERMAAVAAQPRGTRAAVHLYTGVLWCGHCQGRHGGGRKHGEVRYTCSRYTESGECASRSVVENRITPAVRGMLSAYADRIEEEARRTVVAGPNATPKVDPVEWQRRELEKVNARIDKLLSTLLDDLITREEFAQKREDLVKQRVKLTEEIESAEKAAKTAVEPAKRVAVIRTLDEEWDTLPRQQRREFVRQLVERITVYRESRDDARIVVRLHGGEEREFDVSPDWAALAAHARAVRAGEVI